MYESDNQTKKMTAVTAFAVLLFAACMVIFADYSASEEDEPNVKIVTLNEGTENEVEVFLVANVYYKVTKEDESEEEAGVYGLKDVSSDSIVLASFTYEDGDGSATYTVTSVLKEFSSTPCSCKLTLSSTIEVLEADCFKDCTIGDVLVAKGTEGISGCGATTVTEVDIDDPAEKIEFSFAAGEISYPQDKYKFQEMESQAIPKGITVPLAACEFENPYYEMSEWSLGDTGMVAADGANVTVIGDRIYIDGEDSAAAADMTLTANWEEEGYDYSEKYMWATVAIIVIIAIAGIAMFVYRMMQSKREV